MNRPYGDGKAPRLTSKVTNTECSGNIFLVLAKIESDNSGFSIPITPDSLISFEEAGELIDPRKSRTNRCLILPCGDTVSLMIEDNRGNVLAYLLQRASNAQPNELHSEYREVFLAPEGGTYSRNLFDGFSTIPLFTSSNARITSLEFKVQEHGWAVIDRITVSHP